jgi:hypothetical protein
VPLIMPFFVGFVFRLFSDLLVCFVLFLGWSLIGCCDPYHFLSTCCILSSKFQTVIISFYLSSLSRLMFSSLTSGVIYFIYSLSMFLSSAFSSQVFIFISCLLSATTYRYFPIDLSFQLDVLSRLVCVESFPFKIRSSDDCASPPPPALWSTWVPWWALDKVIPFPPTIPATPLPKDRCPRWNVLTLMRFIIARDMIRRSSCISFLL